MKRASYVFRCVVGRWWYGRHCPTCGGPPRYSTLDAPCDRCNRAQMRRLIQSGAIADARRRNGGAPMLPSDVRTRLMGLSS